MPRIIAVASGKGGVGKTLVVSNLGVALVKEGAKVAAVDANLTGANLGLHFGLISYPISLHDVMRGEAALEEAIYKHPSGVDIVPASLSVDDLDVEPIDIRDQLLETFSDKDFVLLDCATGLDRETINALKMSDEVLLVTHPELPTISDALRTKTVAGRFNKEVAGIVLNRVTYEDAIKKENLAAFFGLPVVATIPEDPKVRRSIEAKNPFTLEFPTHRISMEFSKLAAFLLGKKFEYRPSLLERVRSWLGL